MEVRNGELQMFYEAMRRIPFVWWTPVKFVSWLMTVFALGFFLTGCSDAVRPQFISVGTAPPGGTFFVVGGAISQVLNEYKGENHWNVTDESTNGSQENIRRLVRGQLDIALSNAAITYFAVRGEGEWESPQAVQAVMTLAPNIALFITPQNSGVKTMADLRGRRVVIGPAGAGFEYFVGPIIESHGLTFKDLDPLYNTQTGAVDMLADGSAAAAFLGGAIPVAAISQASATQNIHFVPFEEETKARLIREYPFFHPATVPANTYRGQTEPFHGLNVGSMHLITAAKADEALIYEITKTIYENRERVTERHPAGRAINPENVIRHTGTDFHPGAIRYYREIGIWPETEPVLGRVDY
jgi:uncharacterized protein